MTQAVGIPIVDETPHRSTRKSCGKNKNDPQYQKQGTVRIVLVLASSDSCCEIGEPNDGHWDANHSHVISKEFSKQDQCGGIVQCILCIIRVNTFHDFVRVHSEGKSLTVIKLLVCVVIIKSIIKSDGIVKVDGIVVKRNAERFGFRWCIRFLNDEKVWIGHETGTCSPESSVGDTCGDQQQDGVATDECANVFVQVFFKVQVFLVVLFDDGFKIFNSETVAG